MDFRSFLRAISADWVSLMSGIGSIVLLFASLLFQISGWPVLIVAAICFFIAAIRVWTKEHRQAECLRVSIGSSDRWCEFAFASLSVPYSEGFTTTSI